MRNLMKRMKEDKGFTLVEMAVVILIIAALLLLIIPNIGKTTKNVDSTMSGGIKSTVETQAVLYEMNENSIPTLANLKDKGYLNDNQIAAYEKLPEHPETIKSGE